MRAVVESIDRNASFIEADSFSSALVVSACHDDLTIIIVDLRMPGTDGFSGVRTLRYRFPAVPVLVASASEDADDVFRALEAGASGYIAKSASAETLVEAIRLVLVGGVYVPRSLVAVHNLAIPDRASLTPRQLEVLTLLAAGQSNKEIAAQLGTSHGTVKAHVSAIMRQLGARNGVQFAISAARLTVSRLTIESKRMSDVCPA